MTVIASWIAGQSTVCSTLCLDWQQRNFKGLCYCPFVGGNPPVTGGFPHKGTVTREMFPFGNGNVSIWWCHNGYNVCARTTILFRNNHCCLNWVPGYFPIISSCPLALVDDDRKVDFPLVSARVYLLTYFTKSRLLKYQSQSMCIRWNDLPASPKWIIIS